jgi:CheY-like chemotaxis protein
LQTLTQHCAQALETVRLLEQEREAREMARAADSRKDEFLALLGHELRNPLAPIATAIEVMKLRGAADRELPIIERQVRHLIGLVDDLLDVSRVTRGKILLERKRIDVVAAIDDAVEMTAPLMEKKSHSFVIEAPRKQMWVDADPRRLAQVISNLLTNAARYTEAGGRIRVSAFEDVDEHIAVMVEDNGRGIDPLLLPWLFEPFAQGEQLIDRSAGGLGLGLMLVKSLTELHGGSVEVRSEGVGMGSRFIVRLPKAVGTFDEEQTPIWLPPLDSKLRHRVLIVDDNRDAANTLGELLETYGCDVAVAFDGPSALEVAAAFLPNVAILDIGLPVMDGYELCARLKSSFGDSVRMLSLSGYGQEEDRGKSAEAGFVAHLVKPIDATALMAALSVPT